MRNPEISEFGDFQTPVELAEAVCAFLLAKGTNPRSIIEPTCGVGNLVVAAAKSFSSLQHVLGIDINGHYVEKARAAIAQAPSSMSATLITESFFDVDWWAKIQSLPKPLLVIGNPPWVTNSDLSVLGSTNLPVKSNLRRDGGLDAITGKANFDISEWILLKIAQCLGEPGTSMAMLCKTAVARKVLYALWECSAPISLAEVVLVDAMRFFHAAVDACLLHVQFGTAAACNRATVYSSFNATEPTAHWGVKDSVLLAKADLFDKWRSACIGRKTVWRSGIKHDCSAVMELQSLGGGKYRNGLDEILQLEDTYIYPLLKSSHLNKKDCGNTNRAMLVPQEFVGEDTADIANKAAMTWAYLQRHEHLLKKRGSSIYKNRPRYSIFGVGPYTFSPWKVAISALYKKLNFVAVGDRAGKPYVFDDTCCFLSCQRRIQAELLASLLNSHAAKEVLESMIFWDAKRPITIEILERVDLEQLARLSGADAHTIAAAAECAYAKPHRATAPMRRETLFALLP
jgi:hypothetical protein